MINKMLEWLIRIGDFCPFSFISNYIVNKVLKNSSKKEQRQAMGLCNSIGIDNLALNVLKLRTLKNQPKLKAEGYEIIPKEKLTLLTKTKERPYG